MLFVCLLACSIKHSLHCDVPLLIQYWISLLSTNSTQCNSTRHDICQIVYATAVSGPRILRRKRVNRDISQYATKARKCFKWTHLRQNSVDASNWHLELFVSKYQTKICKIWLQIACYASASNKHRAWKTYTMCINSTIRYTCCVKVPEKYTQYA